MTKPATTRSRLSPPVSLTAIALLLAACGGGGGGDDSRSVSASPASSNATVSVDTSTTTSAASNANATTSSSQTGNVGNATNAGTGASTVDSANTSSSPAGYSANTGTGTPQAGSTPAPTAPGTNATPAADGSTANPSQPSTNDTGSSGGAAADIGTTDTTQSPPTTDAQPVPDADTVDGDGKPSITSATVPVPVISAEGVRGETLLAMFDQEACIWHFHPVRVYSLEHSIDSPETASIVVDTPPVSAATWGPDSYTYDMSTWEQEGRYIPLRAPSYLERCAYPDIRSYLAVKPGSYTYRLSSEAGYHTHATYRYYGDPRITRGVNKASISYDLNITEAQVSIGRQVKVSLAEDFGYKASDFTARDVPPGREITADYTGEAYTFRRDALVPFGTMQQWQDGSGNFVQLMLIRGDSANEAKLCTNTNSVLVKRLQCVVWQIPADWSWGRELVGGRHHIVDDRSVYEGESGFLYWK